MIKAKNNFVISGMPACEEGKIYSFSSSIEQELVNRGDAEFVETEKKKEVKKEDIEVGEAVLLDTSEAKPRKKSKNNS